MRMARRDAGIIVVSAALIGVVGAASSQGGPVLLIPGSTKLTGAHFAARCDSMWFVSRGVHDTVETAMTAFRLDEAVTTYHGRPAVLQVVQVNKSGMYVDSALMYRDGLAPIWEVSRSETRSTRYEFDGSKVRVTVQTSSRAERGNTSQGTQPGTPTDSAPTTTEHRYPQPVFNFQQLDAVIRSLPLRTGYEALLPLYSEGDDSVEIDTVRVESRDAKGIWRIRFADPAVVATIGVDERSRAQVAYTHTFRTDGPAWKVGTVWRRAYAACGLRR